MTKQLEKEYLLNILFYIDSLESIKTFISVNKKCQEVTEMLKFYTKRRKFNNNFEEKEQMIIPQNLFTLFPKIETIECNENDLIKHKEIMKKVHFR